MAKHIIIEEQIYKVQDFQYDEIRAKEKEINSNPENKGSDVDVDNYLQPVKYNFIPIGVVNYHFKL